MKEGLKYLGWRYLDSLKSHALLILVAVSFCVVTKTPGGFIFIAGLWVLIVGNSALNEYKAYQERTLKGRKLKA